MLVHSQSGRRHTADVGITTRDAAPLLTFPPEKC